MEVEGVIGALQFEIGSAQVYLTFSNLAMVDGTVGDDEALAGLHDNGTTCRNLEYLLEYSHSLLVACHICSSPRSGSSITISHCHIGTCNVNVLCRVVVEFDIQVAQVVFGSSTIQTSTA